MGDDLTCCEIPSAVSLAVMSINSFKSIILAKEDCSLSYKACFPEGTYASV